MRPYDAIKAVVMDVLSSLTTLYARTIRSIDDKLTITNGKARIDFKKDKVYYNGTEIGTGTGGTSPGGSDDGSLDLWIKPSPINVAFKYKAWGSFSAIELPTSVVPNSGLYVQGYRASDCAFVTEDKLLPNGDYVARVFNGDSSRVVFAGGDPYIMTGSFGSAWSVFITDISSTAVTLDLFKDGNKVVTSAVVNANSNFVYTETIDGVSGFPVCIVRIGNTLISTETSQVEIKGGFATDTAYVNDVDISAAGVYLNEPSNVDLQDKRLILSSDSYMEDTGNGVLGINGDLYLDLKADGTRCMRLESSKVTFDRPIELGTTAITTSKDTFAANELVDREYVDLQIQLNAVPEHVHDRIGTNNVSAVRYDSTTNKIYINRDTSYSNNKLTGGKLENFSVWNNNRGIMWLDDEIPLFPYGFSFGAFLTPETITTQDGKMLFGATTGFEFNNPVNMYGNLNMTKHTISNTTLWSGDIKLIGCDKSIPYFPGGLSISTTGSLTQAIRVYGTTMHFDMYQGNFQFNEPVKVNGNISLMSGQLNLDNSGSVNIKQSSKDCVVTMPEGGRFIIQVT